MVLGIGTDALIIVNTDVINSSCKSSIVCMLEFGVISDIAISAITQVINQRDQVSK